MVLKAQEIYYSQEDTLSLPCEEDELYSK